MLSTPRATPYDDDWLTLTSLAKQIEIALKDTKKHMCPSDPPTPSTHSMGIPMDGTFQSAPTSAERKRRWPRRLAICTAVFPIFDAQLMPGLESRP